MNKCVLLISGGIDSVTSIELLKEEGADIYPLFIDYNQKAKKEEYKSAKYFCEYFGINNLKVYKTDFFKDIFSPIVNNRSLLNSIGLTNTSANYIPFRNLIFSILGAIYCQSIESDFLSFGFIKKDSYDNFPDTSPDFLSAINDLFEILFGSEKLKVISKAHNYLKEDLIRYANEKQIPLSKTYSCYFKKRCNKCESCIEAINAFNNADLADRKYLNPYYDLG